MLVSNSGGGLAMGKVSRKKISPERFALAKMRGATWEESLLRAGYAPSCARRGKISASRACLLEYDKQLRQHTEELRKVGSSLTPDERKALIRGKLIRNVAEGKDESAASLKMLGADREVSLFGSEEQVGVFVFNTPAAIRAMLQPPKALEINSQSMPELPAHSNDDVGYPLVPVPLAAHAESRVITDATGETLNELEPACHETQERQHVR